MPTRVVHHRYEHDVYIGRPSKWGNPFSHKPGTLAQFRVNTRHEAIQKYEEWILTQPLLIASLHELKGKTLGCWCKPKACHGDVLAKMADQLLDARLAERGFIQMAIDNTATKVITGKVRLSYCNIFEPRQDDQGVDKYSTAILIPKSDKETLRKVKAAVDAAVELGKSKWGGKIPANLKKPLRDGDEERPDDEAYAGHYFLNATSKNKPGIAKPMGKDSATGKTKFQEITDTTEVYSGCFAKVSLNFYPYDQRGNRGVAAGLNNVVKVQDGDFLGGRSSVNDDFANEDFDTDDFGDDDDFLN